MFSPVKNKGCLLVKSKVKYQTSYKEATSPCGCGSSLDALLLVQTDMLMNNEEDMKRTININTFNIKSTDFNIKVNDEKYNKLFNSGKESTQKYLSNIYVMN